MTWVLDYTREANDMHAGPGTSARFCNGDEVILAWRDSEGWRATWAGVLPAQPVRLPGRWKLPPELLALLGEDTPDE